MTGEDRIVLLVEDNPILRGILVQILSLDGFSCLEAANENEALAHFPAQVSAVIADINLSETGGDQRGGIILAETLAREQPVPVILISQTPWHYFPAGGHEAWSAENNVHAVLDRTDESFAERLTAELGAIIRDAVDRK